MYPGGGGCGCDRIGSAGDGSWMWVGVIAPQTSLSIDHLLPYDHAAA
jgi:hypothetical protein